MFKLTLTLENVFKHVNIFSVAKITLCVHFIVINNNSMKEKGFFAIFNIDTNVKYKIVYIQITHLGIKIIGSNR